MFMNQFLINDLNSERFLVPSLFCNNKYNLIYMHMNVNPYAFFGQQGQRYSRKANEKTFLMHTTNRRGAVIKIWRSVC